MAPQESVITASISSIN